VNKLPSSQRQQKARGCMASMWWAIINRNSLQSLFYHYFSRPSSKRERHYVGMQVIFDLSHAVLVVTDMELCPCKAITHALNFANVFGYFDKIQKASENLENKVWNRHIQIKL